MPHPLRAEKAKRHFRISTRFVPLDTCVVTDEFASTIVAGVGKHNERVGESRIPLGQWYEQKVEELNK